MPNPPLLLGSSSRYRRERLEALGIPFQTATPDIDETRREGESGHDLVQRLATEKARALQSRYPSHLIIGSDQVAVTIDGRLLTKPGTESRALEQLRHCRGGRVKFLTGLCLIMPNTRASERDTQEYITVEPFEVFFRNLSDATLRRYLRAEKPYDCAGSFKVEGLGITLFERLEGRDPNSLIGLPLIALEDGLQTLGLSLLDYC